MLIFKKRLPLASLLLTTLLAATTGYTQSNSPGKSLSQKDQQAVQKLGQGNINEVQLGKLAYDKASNPAVKDFAKRMISDHDKLNLKLQKVAIQHGVTLPTSPDEEGKNAVKSLSKFSGQDFDRQYMQAMLEDHQKDIAELQKFGQTTQNPAMKDLAAQTLPTLENHIRVAENVSGQIGLTADKGLNQPAHPVASAGETLPG